MRSHAHAHVIRARLPLPREKERVQATQMPRAPFAPSPCAAMTPISPRARRPPLRRLRIERPRRNRRRRYRRRRHRRLARRPCRRRSRSRPRARLPLRAQLRRHVDRGVLPAVEVFEAVETDDRRSVVAKKKKMRGGACEQSHWVSGRACARTHVCVWPRCGACGAAGERRARAAARRRIAVARPKCPAGVGRFGRRGIRRLAEGEKAWALRRAAQRSLSLARPRSHAPHRRARGLA